MPKVSPSQNNFTAGEISPWLYGRFDIAKYSNAAKTLENILIHQAGGGQRRPGTKYVAEVENSDEKTRLVTFEFSTTQTYILEFGNEYIRFFRNRGVIEASPAAYELTTPYQTADLFNLQFAQDADTMWIVHPSYKPRKLTRTAHNVWTLTKYEPTDDPFGAKTTITGATAAEPVVITSVGHGYSDGDRVLLSEFVGGMTQLNGIEFIVTNKNTDDYELYDEDGNKIDGQLYDAYSSGGIAEDVEEFPSCVAMFEQRILFANTRKKPQTTWGSYSGDFEVMTIHTDAGDGFEYAIASDKVNAIRWLKPGPKSLLMGTLGATFSLSSGNEAVAITPTNVSVKRDTTYGAANILPETIGSFIYYVGRDLNHMRELGFSFDIDAQQALDMTILADHIAKAADPLDSDGFTQIAYQQSPVSRLWCVRNDGQMAVLTRQIDQEVIGWSRQLSGKDSRNNGVYESVAIIPTDEGDDEVWVIVKRYINGSVVRYVEYFMPERFDHQQDMFFVDSGLSLDSPKTISGISAKTVIDDMEYASDSATQNAYVSSDATISKITQQQTTATQITIVTGPTLDAGSQGFQVQELGDITKFTFKLSKEASAAGTITCYVYSDNSGKPGALLATFSSMNVADISTSATDYDFTGVFTPSVDTQYHVVLERTNISLTANIWGVQPSNYDYGTAVRHLVATGWDTLVGEDFYFKIYQSLPVLQCYSESVIRQQGFYSLEATARITESLSDTLTRTLATTISLSGLDSIKLDIRASRTGSNIKIGFHDSGGVTTEHTADILVADEWQTETIDISAVDNGDKDVIDSIIITILNADADNTFYIDNIYSPADYITVTTEAAHSLVDDDRVRIVDVIGMVELNNRNFVIEKLGATTFALLNEGGSYIDGSTYTAYISGGEAREMVTTIEGLTHLVGEEVAITADGAAVATKIVNSDGEITLDARASLVHVGLPYISDIALLPYSEGSAIGTAVGKVQRTSKLLVKLYRSLDFEYGPDEDNLDTKEITTLFTGDKDVEFEGDWDREAAVLLRQSQPLSLNVLSITRISEVTED